MPSRGVDRTHQCPHLTLSPLMLALGVDLFGIITGVVGTVAVLIPACRWLRPRRRMRHLDSVVHGVECLLDTLREEAAVEAMLATSANAYLLRSAGLHLCITLS
jgi:hypothetical protein